MAQQGLGQQAGFDELFVDNSPTVSGIHPGQRDVLDEQAFVQGPGAECMQQSSSCAELGAGIYLQFLH